MYHQFKELAGIDITKEPMEVGPTTHYIMGGVQVDADTQMTSVPGLYAAGECASGLHGANRLGGNSLSDLLVFGQRAGLHAAEYARENGETKISDTEVKTLAQWAEKPFERYDQGKAENPFQIQSDLQEKMQDLVGIVRSEKGLNEALSVIEELKERSENVGCNGNREFNPGWHTAIELKHMLTIAEAITRAAVVRKESRGGHYRSDFTEKNEQYGEVNSMVWKDADGRMKMDQLTKTPIRKDLQEIINEQNI